MPRVTAIKSVIIGRLIKYKGTVQGVGFRPTVYSAAHKLGVTGNVLNDGEGVVIEAFGASEVLDRFVLAIKSNCPPLAHIDSTTVETISTTADFVYPIAFTILQSVPGKASTAVVPDARTCTACVDETFDAGARRYRYPFTNCTHCGPRLSIIKAIPYDRVNTSMSGFALCKDCLSEYEDPLDRRFHAQPIACPVCGPQVRLVNGGGVAVPLDISESPDAVGAAARLISSGAIVAVKGLGGFHIACDATNDQAVSRLRQSKRRFAKPFAMMARSTEVIERYCQVSEKAKELLVSAASPIVLLPIKDMGDLSKSIASGQSTLGFMLPYTPLHHLLLEQMERPIVLTSANLSDEPQCTDNGDATNGLASLVDYLLIHDRDIVNRLDDSVAQVVQDSAVILRRARGYAPAPLALPPGFDGSVDVLALGGELKNTFCLIKDGQAILSQHMGDLEDALTYQDYLKTIKLYLDLWQFEPQTVVIDEHPEYLSSKLGRQWLADAKYDNLQLQTVQHHHGHIASCMGEHGRPLAAAPVLGVALDGLGYGEGQLWGGEFLYCDYLRYERLATFKPVPMPGGTMAMREPWRNTYAHIVSAMDWGSYLSEYGALELTEFFYGKNISAFASMVTNKINSPLASSCGRLFDAVAAACGICREVAHYEGQAAIELEALAWQVYKSSSDQGCFYPFSNGGGGQSLPYIEPQAMWHALLDDLSTKIEVPVIALKFHRGLAKVITEMVTKLSVASAGLRFDTVVLSGGVFQNKLLLELTREGLLNNGFVVMSHSQIPSNDGGLALGQALVASARMLQRK